MTIFSPGNSGNKEVALDGFLLFETLFVEIRLLLLSRNDTIVAHNFPLFHSQLEAHLLFLERLIDF